LVSKEEKRDGVIGEWKYNRNRYFRGEIWRRERRWIRVKEKSFVLVCFKEWLTIYCCEHAISHTNTVTLLSQHLEALLSVLFSCKFFGGFSVYWWDFALGEHLCTQDLSVYAHLFITLVFRSVKF
jgi:hypothetical protein